jgi:hypothetical protein
MHRERQGMHLGFVLVVGLLGGCGGAPPHVRLFWQSDKVVERLPKSG